MSESRTYVLYHGNCWDGFGAAWAAWKRLRDTATYLPVSYGQKPPDIPNCERLYILDFSYGPGDLADLIDAIPHVTLLDHHRTAEATLVGVGNPVNPDHIDNPEKGFFVKFDMSESGASLAWQYFYKPEQTAISWTPEIIKYVRDRDLWLFQMPSSREVSAWLFSFPFDFKGWDWLNYCLTDDAQYHTVVAEGKAILRAQQKHVEFMCRHVMWVTLGGYNVPCVNATIFFSECGEYLCEKFPNAPFAAYFSYRNDGKLQWGLRSRNGFDVSEVAKKYNGGGHQAASGFITAAPPLLS